MPRRVSALRIAMQKTGSSRSLPTHIRKVDFGFEWALIWAMVAQRKSMEFNETLTRDMMKHTATTHHRFEAQVSVRSETGRRPLKCRTPR